MPDSYGEGGWTNSELDEWFLNEYGGEAQLDQDWRSMPEGMRYAINEDYEWMEETELDDDKPFEEKSWQARASEAALSGEASFSRLNPHMKAMVRDWVETTTLVQTPRGPRRVPRTDSDLDPKILHTMGDGGTYVPADVADQDSGITSSPPKSRLPVFVAVGLLGVMLVALFFAWLSRGSEHEPPPAAQAASTEEPEPLSAVVPDESGAEDSDSNSSAQDEQAELAVIAGSPEFFDCPPLFQLDVIRRLLSGEEGETSEADSDTLIAQASNPACVGYWVGSHVFSLIVEGDGEALSMADNTSYQVSFVVNNRWPENEFYDDTGFTVRVQWQSQAQAFAGQVLSADQFNPQPVEGATTDIEWLDQSTLQVIVELPGDQVDVTEVRAELAVYITDDDGGFVYERYDVAIWKADP